MSDYRPADDHESTEVAPYARTPSDPWPQSPPGVAQPGASPTSPAAPQPAPAPAPAPSLAVAGPGGRAATGPWLVPVIAGTAVLAVTVFLVTFLWPAGSGRTSTAPLPFRSFVTVAEVGFQDPASSVFAQVSGDFAFAGAVRDDGLEVIAVRLSTGEEAWRRTITGAERWSHMWAVPSALIVVGDDVFSSESRPLIVLDPSTGQEQWRQAVHGNEYVWGFEDHLVLSDIGSERLLGLDYEQGHTQWSHELPEGGISMTAVVTAEDLAGPADLTGGFFDVITSGRVVVVGEDRSAKVIDVRTGSVVTEGTNVASTDDLLLAYEDVLVVVPSEAGYRVDAFPLDDLSGRMRPLYLVRDAARTPMVLGPCGQERICLLDQVDRDGETTEVVAVSTALGQTDAYVWRSPAPDAERLVPVGDHVLVSGGDPAVRVFDSDGQQELTLPGAAARLDAANLLVFAQPPGSFLEDVSLAGRPLSVDDGEPERVELGLINDVFANRCAWNTQHLLCPGREEAVVLRFIRE